MHGVQTRLWKILPYDMQEINPLWLQQDVNMHTKHISVVITVIVLLNKWESKTDTQKEILIQFLFDVHQPLPPKLHIITSFLRNMFSGISILSLILLLQYIHYILCGLAKNTCTYTFQKNYRHGCPFESNVHHTYMLMYSHLSSHLAALHTETRII